MCGIAGVVHADPATPVPSAPLRRMARALRHRGPDGYGLALGNGAGLVSTRLAIVDLADGWQPMRSPTDGSVLVYNGEVYNHHELRADLARQGVRCRTRSDTEVVLRLLERDGLACLDRLNGQFALAWWEPSRRRLTLVRDRFGVRPLHWALDAAGSLTFGSEARAVLAEGRLRPVPDLLGLDDVFTTWGVRAPRSAFAGLHRVRPGGVVVWERGEIVRDDTWWEPSVGPDGGPTGDLQQLLRDSVRLRLRADVPVGAYLSGGLDSSLLTALAQQESVHPLRTFSLSFDDPRYDESTHQQAVATALGTEHHVVRVRSTDVAEGFRDAVHHAEAPLVRTAPVPMMLLARAAREAGITVVASGEGADEIFWGYDVFKEVSLRLTRDAAGLDSLYPHLGAAARGPVWQRFFLDAGPLGDPLLSHQTRAAATGAVRALYHPDVRAEIALAPSWDRLAASLPPSFGSLTPLERTSWLELQTLLEPYLLSAQGDRAAMAHGVEARYPFLDHRVLAHAAALPRAEKLSGQHDKVALRRLAATLLPAGIAARPKQPYRSPEVLPFLGPDGSPAWVRDALSPTALRAAGFFAPERVAVLLRRCAEGRATGAREAMALVGVLSTQVWSEQFLGTGAATHPEESAEPRVLLDLEPATQREAGA